MNIKYFLKSRKVRTPFLAHPFGVGHIYQIEEVRHFYSAVPLRLDFAQLSLM